MQTYLKKNVLTVIILTVTVILTGLAIFTAIRLYQLRDQAVAPNVPSSKPAAQEASGPPTYTRSQTVVLPKFTSEACPWGQGDNLSRNTGRARARISKAQNFDLLPNCTLTGGSVNTLKQPANYLYDDTLLITLDDKVLAGTNTIVAPLGGIGSVFDWTKVSNVAQQSQKQNTKIICIGSTCEAPYTYKHDTGNGKSPLVNISLSEQNLTTLLNTGLTNHTFGAVVIGDNNPSTDCKLQEDLVLTLNYTCETQVVACEEVVFNITAPTPTPTAPPVSCNGSCTEDSQCGGNNSCIGNVCRNNLCDAETDCTCSLASPTPTATPASCNNSCSANSDCSTGLVCNAGSCRNQSCTGETDCTCSLASPTPTATPTVATTATPAPELPAAGISAPTLIGGAAGILLLLGAFLLAL